MHFKITDRKIDELKVKRANDYSEFIKPGRFLGFLGSKANDDCKTVYPENPLKKVFCDILHSPYRIDKLVSGILENTDGKFHVVNNTAYSAKDYESYNKKHFILLENLRDLKKNSDFHDPYSCFVKVFRNLKKECKLSVSSDQVVITIISKYKNEFYFTEMLVSFYNDEENGL